MPLLHLLATAGIGAVLFAVVRWLGRQSYAVQALVAAGLLARATMGVALFWISYLQLPILPQLQLGSGFWSPTLDARGYFDTAAFAVDHGLSSISSESVSPFFTRALAVWMSIVGVSPAAGMLLNLCIYVASCALLTRLYRPVDRWRADLPLVVTIAALSFSPVLLIDSTQSLKDDVFLGLVVMVCAAAMLLFRSFAEVRPAAFAGALGAMALAIYGVAGVRPYYPVIVLGCLAVVFLALALTAGRGRRIRTTLTGVTVLTVVWFAHSNGAGPQVRPTAIERQRVVESLQLERGVHLFDGLFGAATVAVTDARDRFVGSGGDTNVGGERRSAAAVILGVAVIFVPVSFLKSTALVNFDGGRGLLTVTDADTVIMDCSLIAICLIVYRRRRLIGERRAYVWFALGLAVVTAILLGFVVTNFGTLFRMRYLVATPLWMLALAVSPARSANRPGS